MSTLSTCESLPTIELDSIRSLLSGRVTTVTRLPVTGPDERGVRREGPQIPLPLAAFCRKCAHVVTFGQMLPDVANILPHFATCYLYLRLACLICLTCLTYLLLPSWLASYLPACLPAYLSCLPTSASVLSLPKRHCS